MPNLNYQQISEIIQELNNTITGGMIQKIHQPQKDFLTLQIRRPQTNHLLFVCLQQQNNTMYLTESTFSNPTTPSFFCQVLRKYILNGYIQNISLEEHDRVVHIEVVSKREQVQKYYIVVELWGNCGNLYLLNDTKYILNTLHPCAKPLDYFQVVTSSQQKMTGKTKKNFLEEFLNDDEILKWNRAADTFYSETLKQNEQDKHNQTLVSFLKKELKKLSRKSTKLNDNLQETQKSDEIRICGELLKSQLHLVKKGNKEIEVVNYFSPNAAENLTITLDPKKDAKENMQAYFKRYRKLQDGIPFLEQQIQKAEKEIDKINNWLLELQKNNSMNIAELPIKWRKQLFPEPKEGKQKESDDERSCYYKFTSQDNWPIFVGRGSRDNDLLTFKIAKGNDIWLHTDDYPGAHVVIPKREKKEVPERTILDAAQLAAHYSKAKDHNKVSIAYTVKKYVTKPKKAKPGLVYLANKKNIMLYTDGNIVKQLMETKEI